MKTTDLLTQIEKTNKVTEKEINLLKNRSNRGETIDFQIIWDNCPELTKDQNEKGIKFLRNLHKTPNGKLRKNNPFGLREVETLETFEYFELAGFYDTARYGQPTFLIPLYNCIGKETSFQYYYNGEVNIVG